MTEHIYVFKGKNTYLVREAIEDRINSLNVDPFNILRYDLTENTSDDVLEELQTVAFFADLKVVVLRHIEAIDKLSESEQKQWARYFEKPNPDVVLFVEADSEVTLSKFLNELLQSYGYMSEIKDIEKDEFPAFVTEQLEKEAYKMSNDAINMLLERTDYEFGLLEQELNKLKIYRIDEKEITEQDVLALVPKNLENNIFELTNAMIDKNQAKALEIYNDLIRQNEDPLRILGFIASKMRELFHARLLIQKGYGKNEIADFFGYSSGRTYYLIKNASSQSILQLETHLNRLSDLDYEIKSGQKDKKLGLELYLLGA